MKKKLYFFCTLIIIGLTYLLLIDKYHIGLFCPIYKITKLYCPGCGITRMLISILNGKFYQAFRFNPLLFLISPILIFYYLIYFISVLNHKKFILKKYENNICIFLIILFLGYGIIRNLPLFYFLSPTVVN